MAAILSRGWWVKMNGKEVHFFPIMFWSHDSYHWLMELICVKWNTNSTKSYHSGPRLNIKAVFSRYGDSHVKDKTVARPSCLVHPGVRDKRRVSEIDLSQPRHETAFWWRHNGPVTSQLTDRIKWPNYPVELIGIYVHINTHNKESLTQRCRRSTNVQLCLIFLYISIWFSLNGWHALLCIANNRHDVTITTHAINRHFLIWMTTVRQPMKRRRSCVLTLKYIFICVYWWTRQRIHNTLIVVDRYLRLMGDKRFQTRRSLVWNRFIPHSSQVSIYHIKV